MNQLGLVGRITKDPELKSVGDNKTQTKFTLAINRAYRNAEGNTEADYVLCVAWGRLAEHIVKYCGKGSLIGINGRLHTHTYTDKENRRIYSTTAIVEHVRFYALKQNTTTEAPTNAMQDVAEQFFIPEQMLPTSM